jgi:hypothetical protein
LFEDRHCFLNEPTQGILRRLTLDENRGFIEHYLKRLRGNGKHKSPLCPLKGSFDLSDQTLDDFPPLWLHFLPAPASLPFLRDLQKTTTSVCEYKQSVEMIARLSLVASNVAALAG